MSDMPDVLVIGTIKMLAQLGDTEKIVELCNEWLDKFESRPTTLAADVAPGCPSCHHLVGEGHAADCSLAHPQRG